MDIYDALHRWALWGGRRREAGQAHGRVLELGVGGGANLPHYREPCCVVAIDPNPQALPRAREEAAQVSFPVALVRARAEALPFLPQSFDTVLGTLVLCSVTDPPAALRQVARVLAPGGNGTGRGELRLVEHVLPAHGPRRWLVRLIAPLWFRFSHECHLDRETPKTLAAAGWTIRQLREHAGGVVVEMVAENRPADRERQRLNHKGHKGEEG